MSDNTAMRQPHAVLNLATRRHKAAKIERLLELGPDGQQLRMLEVGTGSGGIAHYFATHPKLHCEVHAVDVHDSRRVREGYEFQLVSGVELPYADASFDIVVTNHVIEHVGDEAAQLQHLAEVRRVLRPGGVGYLAVPNRWMLVEPHYHLAFLSWLPRAWRSPYLRVRGRGHFYDCEPLQMPKLERMLAGSGFRYRNVCIEALRATLDIERPDSRLSRFVRRLPDGWLQPWRRIIPTLIYVVHR